MSKQKTNDIYSFKAISSESSSVKGLGESRQSIFIQQEDDFFTNKDHSSQFPNKIKSGIYRHQKNHQNSKYQPELKVFGDLDFRKRNQPSNNNLFLPQTQEIHPKILSLDAQIQQNVKRRLNLEKQLNKLKTLQESQKTYNKFLENTQGTTTKGYEKFGIQKQFALQSLETHFIDKMVEQGNQKPVIQSVSKSALKNSQHKLKENKRFQKINKNIQILNDQNLETILSNGFNNSTAQKEFYDLNSFMQIDKKNQSSSFSNGKKTKKPVKQMQTPTPPPITAIQNMISRLTFPQVPKQNVQKLLQKCQQLNAIHQSHSDIIYLLMVGSFHTGDFHNVRKYFKEILTFKKFENKSYWVAAQAEYGLENYERCIKLSDFCMQNLDDKYLPRFLYLKAKCYNEQGNFTNSIVCYNQLIRIKPKIAQYYLQRAILYDKLGYEKQCKQDYLMFGILKPDAKKYLQEKIIVEANDAKRKQLLQIYKKIV